MKKIITISLAVMLIMINLHSQVYHREYYSSAGTIDATSSACVKSNSDTAYLFKSDGKKIELTKINLNTMQPFAPTSIYSINYTPNYDIYLTDGFVDFYNNIVVFGKIIDNIGIRGVIIKLDLFNVNQLTVVMTDYSSGSELISGCCGYDYSNDHINYAFANKDGWVFTTDSNLYSTYHAIRPESGRFTHITYDTNIHKYLGSGMKHVGDSLLGIFARISSNMSTIGSGAQYYKYNTNFQTIDERTMHIQIAPDTVLLCQGVCGNHGNRYLLLSTIFIPNGSPADI